MVAEIDKRSKAGKVTRSAAARDLIEAGLKRKAK
jgi:metal-responsive CopG/Arc/MetJ family transcriptional regulator